MIGLHSNDLDFEILETGNVKTFVFLDSSEYMVEPEKPLLEVTFPGQTKYFLVNINARQVNTFNSNTLGLTQVIGDFCLQDLPDGVYTLKYKVCPYKAANNRKVKTILRVTALDTKIKLIYYRKSIKDLTPVQTRDIQDRIIEILIDKETGRAYAEQGDVKKATDFYFEANRKADRLLKYLGLNCINEEHKCF